MRYNQNFCISWHEWNAVVIHVYVYRRADSNSWWRGKDRAILGLVLEKKLTYLPRHRTNSRRDTQRMRKQRQDRINKNVWRDISLFYNPISKWKSCEETRMGESGIYVYTGIRRVALLKIADQKLLRWNV